GLKNKDDVQFKLKSWYFHCVEYIQRCVENYNAGLLILLLCSLWGNVEIVSQEEQAKWDTESSLDFVVPLLNEETKILISESSPKFFS
ncbi:protein Njmu-R1, partial [Nephila pilipes]